MYTEIRNVTYNKIVKNVGETPIHAFGFSWLPGQVVKIPDELWIGKELWKNPNLVAQVRNGTPLENEDDKIITYAIETYLESEKTPTTVTVDGVEYDGLVFNEGGNTFIFFKEAVVTPVDPTGLSLAESTKSLNVNDTYQLVVTFTPADTTDKSVYYLSGDETVATVSDTGLVTAIADGTVDIYAISIAKPSVNDSVAVTVATAGGE